LGPEGIPIPFPKAGLTGQTLANGRSTNNKVAITLCHKGMGTPCCAAAFVHGFEREQANRSENLPHSQKITAAPAWTCQQNWEMDKKVTDEFNNTSPKSSVPTDYLQIQRKADRSLPNFPEFLDYCAKGRENTRRIGRTAETSASPQRGRILIRGGPGVPRPPNIIFSW
jgi:hypothetical protein